jgi:energy-coupling factor transporter ATP-binding protein EcfA2
MAITSIRLDAATFDEMGAGAAQLPLDPALEMGQLGPLVVLAGPNGSGKSRILRLIKALLSKKRRRSDMTHNDALIEQELRQIAAWEEKLHELDQTSKEGPLAGNPEKEAMDGLAQAKGRLAGFRFVVAADKSFQLSTDDIPKVVEFVPGVPQLEGPSGVTDDEGSLRADALMVGPEGAQRNAPAYARRIFRRAQETGFARLSGTGGAALPPTPEEASKAALLQTLAALLGDELTYELIDAKLYIGKVVPYASALSPGQQILFQFACMLHAHQASLANCIVVMDEPENHLHPAVLAQIVEALRRQLQGSQLWIATHSVPLIAQLMAVDNKCLWFVSNGRVQHSGRSPERVLESLMGGPRGAQDLHDLTLLPAQYAAARFLSECLLEPEVVGSNVADPQTRQITDVLRQVAKTRSDVKRPLSVLDFGAGKGRVLASLRDGDASVATWLDYHAYDIDECSKIECLREIGETLPGEPAQRWFSDLSALGARVGDASFDVVIMCNVLHEIDPGDWLGDLGKGGRLERLISETGYLLVVEDYGIPVGERAHDYGFLLLDQQELRKLFAITPEDETASRFLRQTPADGRYANRLTAHLVGKACLGRLTSETQHAAIAELHRRMSTEVRDFLRRRDGPTGPKGRDYARCAQLMANAGVWLQAHSTGVGVQ